MNLIESRAWLALPVIMLASCSGSLEPDDIAGTYVATQLVFSGDVAGDVLAEGGSLQLVLSASGSTSGTMVIPAMFTEDNMLVTLDLAGTFTLTDGAVTFNQVADTFIRDTTWQVDGSTLRAMPTFSGVTIDVVPTRQ